MDFRLTKEQELLRDGLGKFLAARYGLASSRAAAKTRTSPNMAASPSPKARPSLSMPTG